MLKHQNQPTRTHKRSKEKKKQLTKTWNKKYLVIKLTSTAVLVGVPSNLLNILNTTGNININTANNAGGKIPDIIPTTTLGNLHIQLNQLNWSQRAWTLDTAPTNATGTAQKRMRARVAVQKRAKRMRYS